MNVSEDQDLQKLATRISADQQSLNLVMHCAGILHETGIGPEKALSQLRRAALARVFDVNTFGPILLAQAVLPLMAREATTHFAVLSAMVGSIGDNRLGGWYAYRASKAALNQLMKTLAIEAKRRYPLLCVSPFIRAPPIPGCPDRSRPMCRPSDCTHRRKALHASCRWCLAAGRATRAGLSTGMAASCRGRQRLT